MWAGTTLGGDLKDYTMRNQFIGPIMDQDLSTQWIKRAGITFSDERGKRREPGRKTWEIDLPTHFQRLLPII